MFGAKRLTRLMIERPLTGTVLLKSSLVRSEVRRRKWLLPPLVRTSTPEPVKRTLLEVALWVFSLYFFPGFALRGIAGVLLSDKINRGLLARGRSTSFGTCCVTFRLPFRS